MTEFGCMLTFPPFRISRSCPLAHILVFLDCAWWPSIKIIKRALGLLIPDLFDNLVGINRRGINLSLIKITGEVLNPGFTDGSLKRFHRFSANLSVMFISGAHSWSDQISCGHVLSSCCLGLGLVLDLGLGLFGPVWCLDLFVQRLL